jgi:peptidoglycan/LPS O-acetylase OafA/YrhL
VLRTGWSRALPDKQQLQRIHALDSIIEESTFVVAPLLTVLLLNVTSARWTLFLGAALIAVAAPMLTVFGHISSTAADSAETPDTPAPDATTDAAPTTRKRQRSLLWDRKAQGTAAPITALGIAGGGITVILPALAEHGGRISSAGFGFAAFSLGGVLGGLLYGRWKSQASLRTKYLAASVFLALALLTLYLPGGTPVTVAAVFITGLAVTPLFVIGYLLLDQHFSDNRHTEANALLGSGYNLGSAMGSTLGGLVLAASGVHLTLALLTAAAATGAAGALRLPKDALQESDPSAAEDSVEAAPNLTVAAD